MAKSSKPKSAKNRVTVQELPTAETKLTEKEMKKVKGGFLTQDPQGPTYTSNKEALKNTGDEAGTLKETYSGITVKSYNPK